MRYIEVIPEWAEICPVTSGLHLNPGAQGCWRWLAMAQAKFLQQSAGRLKDFGEQQQIHQLEPWACFYSSSLYGVLLFRCALRFPPSPLHNLLAHTTLSLSHTQLPHTQLTHTHNSLSHTQLTHTRLSHTQLSHTQLTHTTPSHTQLSHTQLTHTTPSHTHNSLTHNSAAVCVAGVALGDIQCHLAWQAWPLWPWAGSGALGSRLTPWSPRQFV